MDEPTKPPCPGELWHLGHDTSRGYFYILERRKMTHGGWMVETINFSMGKVGWAFFANNLRGRRLWSRVA